MCANVPLLLHSLQIRSSTKLHWCKFTGDGRVSYTDISRNKVLNWFFLHSSVHFNSPTSSRPLVFQVPSILLFFDLPLCAVLLSTPWRASLLLKRLTTAENVIFPLPVAQFVCFQWCFESIACSLLGSLMFLLTTFFLSLSGSKLVQFCCPPSPVTFLTSSVWIPWTFPPQRILVSVNVRSYCVVSDRCKW